MNLAYWFSYHFIVVTADIFFRGETVGLEHVPARGPFVIAANHCSHLDPPLLGCRFSHQINFFARRTLWKPGLPARWLDAVGCIPVDREGADVAAIRRIVGVLEAGGVVIMFPEGTRSPDGQMRPPKSGVGLIACKTRVPIVPARIFGSFAAFGRQDRLPRPHPVSVTIGRPLLPADYDDPQAGKRRYQVAAERVMDAIAALQEPRNLPI